jgi:hypothetical protein
MSWNYRVIEQDGLFAVHEVFYNPDESVAGVTETPVFPRGETFDDLAADIARYAEALSLPVLRVGDW